jgi:outer membrane protein assembly factor BamB
MSGNSKQLIIVLTLFTWLAGMNSLTHADDLVLPDATALSKLGLEIYWWNQATLNNKRETVDAVVVDELGVVVQSNGGNVSMFDVESGQRLWSRLIGQYDEKMYPGVLNRDTLIISAGLKLQSIRRFDGKRRWEISIPYTPACSPGIDDNQVYIGMLDGGVHAYNMEKIAKDKSLEKMMVEPRLVQSWRYKTGASVTVPPVSNGTNVFMASRDNSLYSVTASQRRLTFQFETDDYIGTPLEISKDSIFVYSNDHNFYCLNIKNGQVRWSFVSSLSILKRPIIVGNQLFLTPNDGGMFTLNPITGAAIWKDPVEGVEHFLAASEKFVYGMHKQGYIAVIDRANGQVVGTINTKMYGYPVQNDRTDRLILASPSGLIVCLKQKNQEFPLYHRYPERRPLIPFTINGVPGQNEPALDENAAAGMEEKSAEPMEEKKEEESN